MADDILHFDQSTWLAKRAMDAKAIGTPEPPSHFTFPGAMQGIPRDRVEALQAAGHDEAAIVARTNAQWAADNQERIDAHRGWVGHYRDALKEMGERAARRTAEELRKRAIFEKFMAEHQGDD